MFFLGADGIPSFTNLTPEGGFGGGGGEAGFFSVISLLSFRILWRFL
ncbi:hypothetical protein VCRA2123E131_10413 [Vibrio crassostreae]|nr:hypothetical protein VCRA2126E132_10413 [Vibrio crassostreae]CAK3784013.1 hypothetical protein VCRA2123E131_10413 [Vibrio crassostreae]